jgi:membrane protein DedA with SNARE-associated domain
VGKWLLVIGYFIPGVRHFSAMVAGSSKLSYPEFAPFAYAGALLWSSTFVSAGYFLGKEWNHMSRNAHHIVLYIAAGLLAIGCIWWLFHRIMKKRKAQTKSA